MCHLSWKQLEIISWIIALIYFSAIFGLESLQNHSAAGGWAAACFPIFVLAILWHVARKRLYAHGNGSVPVHHPDYAASPSASPPLLATDPMIHTAHTTAHAHTHSSGASAPLLQPSVWTSSPVYVHTCFRFSVGLYTVACLALAIFFYVYSAQHDEPLDGRSHWMAAIAFTVAVKASCQLLYGVTVIRKGLLNSWQSAQHQQPSGMQHAGDFQASNVV